MPSRRRFLQSAAALGGVAAAGLPGFALAEDPRKRGEGPRPGEHVLPPLPYAYDALEPYIDEETMRLHHDKHHAGYVKGLNGAEKALVLARQTKDFGGIASLERDLAFHGNGHFNHVLFWNNMKPAKEARKRPAGELARLIGRDFGNLDALMAQFTAAAAQVEGNGWGALVYHPFFHRLYTVAVLNHQNSLLNGAVPLLMVDVWEHAYYLKYQNKRGDYLASWWNVVDWAGVELNFDRAQALRM
ncbi:MAG: superoxide dismutase [Candidatus Eisenbacteria bacterium]